MKKLFAIAGTALLMVGLASCSSNNSAAPDPTYTPTSEPTPTYIPEPEPTYSTDEIYVSVIRQEYPYYASLYSDSELVNIGKTGCQYFADGGTFEELAYYLVATIDAPEDAFGFMGFVIGSGVAAYCPEYKYLLS